MPHRPGHINQGTPIEPLRDPAAEEQKIIAELTPKQRCVRAGGFWDERTQTCIPKFDKPPQPEFKTFKSSEQARKEKEEQIRQAETSGDPFVTTGEGTILTGSDIPRGEGVGARELIEREQQKTLEAQALASQVGQFSELSVAPTDISQRELLSQGVVSGIPRALTFLGTAAVGGGALGGALAGARGGALIGSLAAPGVGTLIGGAVGLIGGISGAIISNFKSQRTDTTTAQQRVLDEGKQILNDWISLARTDPGNKSKYLANFNAQLALINQAYRQMQLDTKRDVLKFETALPNLAEFESFYNNQGERDFLVAEMRNALLTSTDPEFSFLELADRRFEPSNIQSQ